MDWGVIELFTHQKFKIVNEGEIQRPQDQNSFSLTFAQRGLKNHMNKGPFPLGPSGRLLKHVMPHWSRGGD